MHDTTPSYRIITDSSCDLPASLADDLGLTVLPLSVTVNGKEYRNYLDEREISFADMYRSLRAGAECKTAAANADAFEDVMRGVLDAGQDVLYIGFSSALSNTFNAGRIAQETMRAAYPQRSIVVVDSLCASLGQGLLVRLAVARQREGASLEETAAYLEATKLHLCHIFTVDDLKFLSRGGRIPAAAALVGTVLQIKPVMHMDDNGKLVNMYKVRGRRKALKALVDEMETRVVEPDRQTVCISHGDCLEDAEYVASLVRERFAVRDVIFNHVGPVIGAHSGPGTIALFFLGTKR